MATFEFHYLSLLDILVREIELLCWSPHRQHWTNHAVVQPLARGIPDGKVMRSSPLFTFASVDILAVRYLLGDDVQAETPDGIQQLCKIVSIFLFSETADDHDCEPESCIAVRVQLYSLLSDQKASQYDDAGPVKLAQRKHAERNELILDYQSDEIMLKGEGLGMIKHMVTVVEHPRDLVRAHGPRCYVCRYALEDRVCVSRLRSCCLHVSIGLLNLLCVCAGIAAHVSCAQTPNIQL